jgi:hypothetical protein
MKKFKLECYAYIFKNGADVKTDEYIQLFELHSHENYENMLTTCKKLYDTYNTNETFIVFETGIKEHNKKRES